MNGATVAVVLGTIFVGSLILRAVATMRDRRETKAWLRAVEKKQHEDWQVLIDELEKKKIVTTEKFKNELKSYDSRYRSKPPGSNDSTGK